MIVLLSGCATESTSCDHWVPTNDMLIVSVIFGKCLLKDWHPHGAVITDMSKPSVIAITPWAKREQIVNDDCVRNTQRVEVDSINSSVIEVVRVVKKDLFEASWDLSKGRGSGKEPAIANITLVDIFYTERS